MYVSLLSYNPFSREVQSHLYMYLINADYLARLVLFPRVECFPLNSIYIKKAFNNWTLL